MRKKQTPQDPIAAHSRKVKATRRVGEDRRCACGEARPEALIPGSEPTSCVGCDRIQHRRSPVDDHHPAGKSNSPVTVPIPVNDHRAELSTAQQDWPRATLENPQRSPLLAAAACIRGLIDTICYLLEKLLLWVAEMLELLDKILSRKLGTRWWEKTELQRFEPKC